MQVQDIMSSQVVFITPDTPVTDIARLLYEYKISGVPVLDDDKVVGIVTEEDMIMRDVIVDSPHVLSLFDSVFYFGRQKEIGEELSHVLASKASELMTTHVYTIRETASIEELATMMIKHEVSPVPVMNETGRLVGIVSRADIIRLMALQQEQPAEPSSGEVGQA